ncbi:DUF4184 family protein [Paenibacillus dendritiformis]|uniref:DUF4184 family protein n=1 Tax=Paenibacillus dendritiformis TaxID=130049 RepID=UPI0023EE33AD|nr:DUF4184 family protein [Paenibacillus dendritiformis]
MPYTLAHPLYAAPLKLLQPKYLSLTGIILGSMAPDFEFFIALEPYQTIGHSTLGLFLYAIPLSLLLAVLFHYLIKDPLARHLPSIWDLDRKAQGLARPWRVSGIRGWTVFLISVIIGFYAHVLLDGFTHETGIFVGLYPLLQQHIMGTPVYKLLQYGLSIIGLLVEGIILVLLLSKARCGFGFVRVKRSAKVQYWAVACGTAIAVAGIKLFSASSTNYIGIIAVAPISGFFLGLIAASALSRMKVIS